MHRRGEESPAQSPSPHPPPRVRVDGEKQEPAYHNLTILKSPVWKWEIASYFFLGGISGASYVLARSAERAGGERFRNLTRAGTYIAFASVLPCAPLLIADLGDRSRFHHMLRIFKPTSPMNLGTWIATGYGGVVTMSTIREKARDRVAPSAGRRRAQPRQNWGTWARQTAPTATTQVTHPAKPGTSTMPARRWGMPTNTTARLHSRAGAPFDGTPPARPPLS
jgi:hypothetical protein